MGTPSRSRAAPSLFVFAVTSLLACCGKCDGGTEPAPDPGGFTLAASPTAASLKPGESTTATVTVTRTGKFTGAVSLRVDGAPAGVTPTLSPASLPAGSTSAGLGIATAGTTAAGTYILTIVGSASGQTDRTATFTLTVTDPGRFALALNPTALSVQQNKSGNVAVTIARTAPFADAVALTIEGAPAGVTGAFAPATVPAGTTAATLTLTVAAGAAPGTYPLTVRGTGTGVAAQTATVTLTVTADPGSFTLALNPTADSIKQGRRDSVTVTIARVAPFTGAVALAVTGAPAGVTASFNPAAIATGATTSRLALDVGAGAAPGTYQLSVQGTATGLTTQSATLALTVVPDPGSFTIALQPAVDSIQVGRRDSVTVTIARVAPFTGAVALAVTGAPAGVTASFDPASVPAGSITGKLVLDVGTTTAPGTYQLTVQGTAAGLPVQSATLALTIKPCCTIALSAGTLSVPQGQSGNVTVTLTRVAPFTGAVALTLNNIPAWGNWHFAPSTIPAGSTTSTLTVGAGATTVPGTYTLTVRGTAAGCPDATATLTFTVTSVGGITVNTTPVSVRQGQNGTTPITIGRVAPFGGAVSLTAENLPAGVTAAFNPALVELGATTSQLTFSALATVPVGSYQVTIRAAGTGLPAGTATQTLNVTAPPAPNITFRFCDPANQPVWMGYQSGTDQWTQVAGSDGSFPIPIPDSKGGIAFVTPWGGGGGYSIIMFLGTREELIEAGAASCSVSEPSKRLTGSVAGLASNDEVVIAVGNGWGEVVTGAPPNYAIPNASLGTRDLFAARVRYTTPEPLPSIIIRRDTNYPAGGVIPLLDFGSAEPFAPTTQTVTTANLGNDQLYLEESYITANGTIGYVPLRMIPASGTYMVIPPAQARAGEVYGLRLDARATYASPSRRVVHGTFSAATAQSFTLGPAMAVPTTFTLQAAPFYQVRVKVTLPAEYDKAVQGEYDQETREGMFYITTGYLGGRTVDISTPDLTRVPGWQPLWGPIQGAQTLRTLTGYGWTGSSSTLYPGNLTDGEITQPGVVMRKASLRDQVVAPSQGQTR